MSSSPEFPSGVDSVRPAMLRRAEKIYTKMGIRRDESEDLGRKKKDESTESSVLWEDMTEVSLVALRSFLEDLLGIDHSVPITPPTILSPNVQPPPSPPTSPSHSLASHAAHAYETTGKAVHDENVAGKRGNILITTDGGPPDSSSTPSSSPSSQAGFSLGADFGESERATLRGYIQDLTQLEQQGVETLTLQRSLTFLESIQQAIAAASVP